MANRNFPSQKLFNQHVMMVQLDCQIQIGASGAVSSFYGKGVNAVAKLATGIYRIQLQDNYQALIQVDGSMISPLTGSAITAGSFVIGTPYRITTLGNTNYTAAGLPSGLTPAIGMTFVATAIGSGTGTATAIGNSGVASIECLNANTQNNASGMMSNQPAINSQGGYIYISTLAPTSVSVTTSIPANPASGSAINMIMILSNSQVQ